MHASLCLFVAAGVLSQDPIAKTQSWPVQVEEHHKENVTRDQLAPELREKLKDVKRIFVEDFGQDPDSKRIQAMIVDAIAGTKRFVITENKDRADAVLRGTATETTFQEFHALNDKAAASSASGGHSGNINGSFVNGTGTVSGQSSGGFSAHSVAADDSTASTETIHEARASVRLVHKDGDVIWSTTQESKGAKYKSASADVAFKVQKQLQRDLEKVDPPKVP